VSEANKRLTERALMEIYGAGKLALADELIHPDFVATDPSHPGGPTGPESVKQTAARLRAAFGPLGFEIHEAVAEDDRVVQRVTMSGSQGGRDFAVQHVYGWRIADGRIVEHWGSRDDLGLLRQLGRLPDGWDPWED
jgi:predicted ester cyclase